jgi:hypothetical protein
MLCTKLNIYRNSSLTELYLGSNNIDALGCCKLAEALKENSTLTKIDLQSIRMGSSGALAIADALRTNSSLIEIIIELDKIPAEDVSYGLAFLERFIFRIRL